MGPEELQDPASFFSQDIGYGSGKIKNYWTDTLLLVPEGSGSALDLGCGNASTRARIEAQGYTWIGLDIARRGGVTVVGDAHRLPFQDASFAVIYSSQVFEHLIEPWRAAAEAWRVLKPGGIFCGSVSCLEPFHGSYFNYTHWGLEALLRRAGFVPKRIEAGPSAFLVLFHHVVGGAGPELTTPITKIVVPPGLWLLRVLGKAFIALRYGASSGQMQKLSGYFEKLPLRFAGHLQFVAERPKDAAVDSPREPMLASPGF